MPSISIDTFFACTLMIAVVLVTIVSVSGSMMTRISDWKNIGEDDYLRSISDSIISKPGTPENWGTTNLTPKEFGLAAQYATVNYELDIDKATRLNSQNAFCLSYPSISSAARLNNIALRLSISQLLKISASPTSNVSNLSTTQYSFTIQVEQDSGPVASSLHCYVLARNYLNDTYGTTGTNGSGVISFQIPNTSNGTASLIVFARALDNSMITSYDIQPFAHDTSLIDNNTALQLSPLDYTLQVGGATGNLTITGGYALTYGYEMNLTQISNSSFSIPKILDQSPTVLALYGFNQSEFFAQGTSYPQVPLDNGANFNSSESHVFVYMVTIKNVLYKLTVYLGGTSS